ncbi:MAG TPA: hypothetical protein VK717_09085 [Opitutaceae bacterium]|jgi:hypothetical protein|nr:hypothetical protein [Opitutaceae bacterium]
MALWEYKVITSGKGGFATPALLEKFLNDLGKEEWEIMEFRTQPDNPLAFSGLARRPTQRDWTLEDAAAAAARTEAEKLRVEFEAKFKAATSSAAAGGKTGEAAEPDDKLHQDDTFRRPRDTERDLDPTASEEDEALEIPEEEELPTFFDAIRPHMRRNQRGPGLSVSLEYLVKKFDMLENDLIGALKECGMALPAGENEPPVYVEYDGDLYWVNVNRQRQLFINTREKPRPVFRTVQAARVGAEAAEEPRSRNQEPAEAPVPDGRHEAPGERSEDAPVPAVLPEGPELLAKLRPMMRRNRGGWSGSLGFLSRALKCREADLGTALAPLGLRLSDGGEKAPEVEIGGFVYWLNKDGRGQAWINATEKAGDAPQKSEAAGGTPSVKNPELPLEPLAAPAGVLAAVRLLLKATKTGAIAGKVDRLAEELGKGQEEFLAALTGAGLKVPERPREKPVFVEQAGEIFWLNKNAKDELWLNAKASKFADGPDAAGGDEAEKKSRRGRSRKSETP